MEVLDYARSTITFDHAGMNQARIAVESSCRLDFPDREPVETWLVASCKAEQTYGPGQLFREPNYDFCIIYGRERYAIRRVGARVDGDVVESGSLAERFEAVRFDLVTVSAERLVDGAAVVQAGLANRRVVVRHRLRDAASGATATIEYPVKTLNVHPPTSRFQTDTGPIALPSDKGWDGDPGGFDVAYAACNDFETVEWIRQRPLALSNDVTVQHFHVVDRMPSETSLWAVVE